VLDILYAALREAAAFSLLVGGASFLLSPKREVVRRKLGLLFTSVGVLFGLSALDTVVHVQEDLSNLIILPCILALSQALYEIELYLFGDARQKQTPQHVLIIGAAWSAFLLVLPLLDYLGGMRILRTSIEDSAGLAPFHLFTSLAAYALPIAIAATAARTGRCSLRDISIRAPETRVLIGGVLAYAAILLVIVAGMACGSITIYRAGQSALELLTIAWFLFASARPDIFSQARREIGEEHKRYLVLGEDEARTIGERIERAAANPAVICRSELDLRILAEIIKVPYYRLSIYFNQILKTSFPSWLNSLRINLIQRRMCERPDLSILDIATEAGYSSKSSFNNHFSKKIGMSPSEYRRSVAKQGSSI
jgi:AraC-like DNA-binding protein